MEKLNCLKTTSLYILITCYYHINMYYYYRNFIVKEFSVWILYAVVTMSQSIHWNRNAIHCNKKLKYGVVFLFVLVLVCLYTLQSTKNSGGYIKFEDQPIRKVREKLKISSKDVPVIIVDEHQEGTLPCFKLSYYLLTYLLFSFLVP